MTARRLFVAVWLPVAARRELRPITDRLRATNADVRWVPPENLHVTLRFLGDVESARVDDLIGCLSRAFAGRESFAVRLGGLGRFPPRGAPRVVWVGMETGARELASLASHTEKVLLEERFLERIDERPFRAHVTLGRPKGSRGVGRLSSLLEEGSFRGGTHLLEQVTLAESRLLPRGATYTAVAHFPLRSGEAASVSNSEGGS